MEQTFNEMAINALNEYFDAEDFESENGELIFKSEENGIINYQLMNGKAFSDSATEMARSYNNVDPDENEIAERWSEEIRIKVEDEIYAVIAI